MLTGIETIYRGCRFRSRLEARWAVFMDAAGIQWEYEPEGYVLSVRDYLPDFWLPRNKAFLEIKPRHDLWGEQVAEVELILTELADRSGYEVFLIIGSPVLKQADDRGKLSFHEWPSIVGFAPDKGVCSAWLKQCPHCENVTFTRSRPWTLRCECQNEEFEDGSNNHFEWPSRILIAMKKARGARFEHGEHP